MIPTEGVSARYTGLEGWPTQDMVTALLESQIAATAAALAAAAPLAQAVEAAAARLESGGRLLYLGAGTSGRLAALDAAELPPTFGWPPERAVALMAGGPGAFVHAAEGAEDDGPAAVAALEAVGLTAQDVVIGLAASGRTPFVVAGLDHARAAGALTIAIGNNPNGAITRSAEIALTAATGAEVLAGSTRMKAGTAQKIVLNLFSTQVMILLGRVHLGLMVDMQAKNEKLRRRAVRMLHHLTGIGDDAALEAALAEAGGRVKTAVLVLRGQDRAGAEALLLRHGGRLRRALEEVCP
jgi:N-acetylmuramic acid 6-phosphate etherase